MQKHLAMLGIGIESIAHLAAIEHEIGIIKPRRIDEIPCSNKLAFSLRLKQLYTYYSRLIDYYARHNTLHTRDISV